MMGCVNEYTRRYTQVVAYTEINRTASMAAHEEIYACIKNQDTDNAGNVTRKHLSRMLAIMGKLEKEQKITDSGGELRTVLDLLRQREGSPQRTENKE
jgi:DNA-binding FadR family transcriptional regulator